MLSTNVFCRRINFNCTYLRSTQYLILFPGGLYSQTAKRTCTPQRTRYHTTSIIGLVVEFVVAIDEARVRFTDDAQQFIFYNFFR
ncbi:hypothetical protein N7516_004390 [Penicillium verrucosum]|uniref:uncharacterized protein n=1 Tax=Penicillium verrucosum TaxID=60171 RepID=UPI0025455737|nr:uncharacterized protein N7516_004390 [Penicillium verrucosum]KAJ5944222.1 hypothetical protein N7516_004390 [Penicillium verrucosum]